MYKKIAKLFRYTICTLFVVTVLIGCGKTDKQLRIACEDFSQSLNLKTLDGLCLKIYYIDPSILTRAPQSVDNLISSDFRHEITVDSEQLKEYVDLLKQLNIQNMVPVKETSYLHARLCYIFETEQNEKKLEIAVGGENKSVFVNGVEVAYNDVFQDILEPFVTEEVMNDLEYIFEGTLKTSNKTGDGTLSSTGDGSVC